jgi:hypothetical protein
MRPVGLAVVLVLAAAAACGRGGAGAAPSAPDLATPRSTLEGALRALEAGDLGALAPYLSPEAADRLRRDLSAWREMLVHPREGPRLLALAPPPKDAREADGTRRALAGDVAGLLRLYVATEPHPYAPAKAPDPGPGGRRVEGLYRARDGSWRSVLLALEGDRWRVERLQL